MRLHEQDEFCYLLDIREFDDIEDTGELMDILMDEYRLDAEFDDRYTLKVYAYSDEQVEKLERMMNDYGASEDYINLVLTGEIKENKNIKFNMRHGINNCRRNTILEKKDGCGCGKKQLNEASFMIEDGVWHGDDAWVVYRDGSMVTLLVGNYSKDDALRCARLMSVQDENAINDLYGIDIVTADIDEWIEQNSVDSDEWDEEYDMWSDDLDETVDNSDLDDLYHSLFEAAEKDTCNCRYKGKKISKMDKVAKRDAKAEIREEIKELKKQIKEVSKAGKSTKALEAKLEKLTHTLDCLMGKCEAESVNESISDRFAKVSKLFESEEEDDEKPADETPVDEEPVNDDEPAADEDPKADDAENEDEYEDVEMKAVVLTVLKKDLDKVKEDLVAAGISEDHIDMPECEDAKDEDECEIRVDAEAVAELAEYLKGKGIDLEEEIGGEIVSDAEEDAVEDKVADEEGSDETADDETPEEDDFSEEDFNDIFK